MISAPLHLLAVVSCPAMFKEVSGGESAVPSSDSLSELSPTELRQQLNSQTEQLNQLKQQLWMSDTYLSAILSHSPVLISVKDLDGNVVLASDHYKQLAELDDSGFVGKNVFDAYPPEVAQQLWEYDRAAGFERQSFESELDIMHKDGSLHTYLMLKYPLTNRSGEAFAVCTICTDITERKRAEDALREQQSRLNYMAFHDSLTSLPNRSLFYDRIFHGLARARRAESKLAVMLLDLDRFKVINDSLGHDAGDLMLKTIAQRLLLGVREMDTVARLGGDEFVVILENVDERETIAQVAEKLLLLLAEPIEIAGHQVASTVSIGISLFPDDASDTDELLKHADLAMYKAKEAGKNTYQFFRHGMNDSAFNYLLLENDLRRAVEQQQFTLHYQPQIDLASGAVVGVEALVRWFHPERGLVSPAHFVPLAEETGVIVALGDWVLREACRQHKLWLDKGLSVGRMAVNISPRQFRQSDFIDSVAAILAETDLAAEHLELEITESTAMEHASETIFLLRQLNDMGVKLAIDDFGTGYSSLAYLKRFPIHTLKIDRSFIDDVHRDSHDAAIAQSVIALAQAMNLNVLAEGVESEEQVHWLSLRGCDQVQGYFYAPPLPAESLQYFCRDLAAMAGRVRALELA